MNATTPKCLRCGTQMEEGFIPGERNKVVLVTIWVAGRPEPSFWKGYEKTQEEVLTRTGMMMRRLVETEKLGYMGQFVWSKSYDR